MPDTAAASPAPHAPPPGPHRAIRAVAWFEAAKALLVLAAGSGLLALLHRDVHALAAALIAHAHLNPASHYPRIFLDAAANLGDTRLLALAGGALAYAALRAVEAWGLYFERPWAEVLAAVSGAVYVPFEVAGLLHQASWHGALLLGVNLGIVALMVRAMMQRRRAAA